MSKISSKLNDLPLLKLMEGDRTAFEKVYHTLHKKVYHFVRLSILNDEDAEEIVQEVFLKIWEKRKDIDLDKSFQAFVYTIAKNKVNDHLRKVLQEKKYLESVINEFSLSDNDIEKVVNYRETEKVLHQLISLLPEKRKKAFELSRLQGKSYREIGKEMNVSENTVDTHIRKALSFLREGMVRFSSFFIF